MDQTATYTSLLGSLAEPITVSLTLPRLGEHGLKKVAAEALGREYYHFGHKIHRKSKRVNIHVYGESRLIEKVARSGTEVMCRLELFIKRTISGREFILVDLHLAPPTAHETHTFTVVQCTPNPEKRPPFVYTTTDMNGIGIAVVPIA